MIEARQTFLVRPLVFLAPAVLSLGAYQLTRLNFVGPGVSAAWAAAAVGAGQPGDAWLAPLYRLLMMITGSIAGTWIAPHQLAGWINVLLMAAAVGFLSLLLHTILHGFEIRGSASLAALGAALAATAIPVWDVCLTLNPAPLAFALLFASFNLFAAIRSPRHQLAAVLMFMLSLTAAPVAILLLPGVVLIVAGNWRTAWPALLPATLPPLLLFLIPPISPVFRLNGYFSQPPGLPTGMVGLALSGWSAVHALTPAGFLLALAAVLWVIRNVPSLRVPLLLTFLALAGAACVPGFSDWAAVATGFFIAALASISLALGFKRLPRGYSMTAWILLPLLWLLHGPDVSRHGEDLWEVNARNLTATQRYQSLIATTDQQRLLAPFLYLQQALKLRPDLVLVDPTLLGDPRYLQRFESQAVFRDATLQPSLDSLHTSSRNHAENQDAAASRFFLNWVRVAVGSMQGGVMFSSELHPGPGLNLVPEGLLGRVWNGKTYPFLFEGLDLGPIFLRDDPRPLVNQTVREYAMLFARRAGYLARDGLTVRVADYVRWALRIDPDCTPARLLAEQYSIHGDPLQLRPKKEPAKGGMVPGVSEILK